MKKLLTLCSDLHSFWWEICYYLNRFSLLVRFPIPLAAFKTLFFFLHFQKYNNCVSWCEILCYLSCLGLTQLLEPVGLYRWTNFGSFQLLSLSMFLAPASFSSDSNDTNIRFFNNPKGPWASVNFYLGGGCLFFLSFLLWLILFFPIFWFTCSFFCPLYSATESIHWAFHFGYCIFFSSKICICLFFIFCISLLTLVFLW